MRALLLAILSAGLVAGCTAAPPTPPPVQPTVSNDAIISSLLAKPLRLPSLAPGAACPVSKPTPRSPVAQPADSPGLGTGPLYPITFYIGEDATLQLRDASPSPNGLYLMKVVWASTGAREEPAVVRVGRIDGQGRGRIQLFHDEAASRGDAVVFPPTQWPADYPSGTEVSGPGCYGYQIDGVTFEEIIIFRVV